MKLKTLLATATLLATGSAVAEKKALNWEQLRGHYQCPEWFADARLGIWCHWGAQTAPAEGGGWYARHMFMPDVKNEDWGKNAYKYHCETYGHPSEHGYIDVLDSWKAENLDTDSLIHYFQNIGAKYFIILANHHDHFDNWNSKYHEWNSMNAGPHRDIVGEFSKSAKKYGMPFCVSSHDDRYLWWFQPAFGCDSTGTYAGRPYEGRKTKADGKGKWWEGMDPANLYGIPPEQRTPQWEDSVKRHWLQRHKQLVTDYDVDMLWFDGFGFPYGDYGKELCTYYYNLRLGNDGKIHGAVAGKISNEPSTIRDIECGGSDTILSEPWQGTLTPNSWFYKVERPMNHSARTILEMLVDMNSKNGNLMLNVELQPDGTIPPGHRLMLDQIGEWMKINGEAVYGSRPWKVFGDNLGSIARRIKSKANPTETDLATLKALGEGASEQFNQRTLASPLFGPDEVRFTKGKDGSLYIFVLAPEEGEISLPSLGLGNQAPEVKKLTMLGGDEKIEYRQKKDALTFKIPAKRPTRFITVFKAEMK